MRGGEGQDKRKIEQRPEKNPVPALLRVTEYCDCGCLSLQAPIADFSCHPLCGFDFLVV